MTDPVALSASAPGKIVAWGEYAVLAGAPACVMAVDRYARVKLSSATDLQLSAEGFDTPSVQQQHLNWTHEPVAAMAESILQQWGYNAFPEHWHIHQDTRSCYHHGRKLGIGSSAALCVALYRAFTAALQLPASFPEALEIHRAFQGGSGSGLDVAASWYGGTIRFQQQQVQPLPWPADLGFCVVFTGQSASTAEYLKNFSKWRASATTTPLDDLCQASSELTANISSARLASYIAALRRLDEAAALNIFTDPHLNLTDIAEATDVLYKPCGAGGGDIGMAFSTSSAALAAFRSQAAIAYEIVALNIAPAVSGK